MHLSQKRFTHFVRKFFAHWNLPSGKFRLFGPLVLWKEFLFSSHQQPLNEFLRKPGLALDKMTFGWWGGKEKESLGQKRGKGGFGVRMGGWLDGCGVWGTLGEVYSLWSSRWGRNWAVTPLHVTLSTACLQRQRINLGFPRNTWWVLQIDQEYWDCIAQVVVNNSN